MKKTLIKNLEGVPQTKLLYFKDPYKFKFKAEILKKWEVNGKMYIVLDKTYFYPEGGGQPSDKGYVSVEDKKYSVVDVQKIKGVIVHECVPSTTKSLEGKEALGEIDSKRRVSNMRCHTASHIVMSAIEKVKGKAQYAGFGIEEGKVRLDVQTEKITPEDLEEIERLSNKVIYQAIPVKTYFVSRSELEKILTGLHWAKEIPLEEKVRIVEIEGFDKSICSGTHCLNTIEIGMIKVINKFRLQKGVERIEFLVGEEAVNETLDYMNKLSSLARKLNISAEEIPNVLMKLRNEKKRMEKEIEEMKQELTESKFRNLISKKELIGTVEVVTGLLREANAKTLGRLVKKEIEENENLFIAVGGLSGKPALVAGGGSQLIKKGLNVSQVVSEVCQTLGGRGGGSKNIGFGGSLTSENIAKAVEKVKERIVSFIK